MDAVDICTPPSLSTYKSLFVEPPLNARYSKTISPVADVRAPLTLRFEKVPVFADKLLVINTFPTMWSMLSVSGTVVPMPTRPEESMRTRSMPPVLNAY